MEVFTIEHHRQLHSRCTEPSDLVVAIRAAAADLVADEIPRITDLWQHTDVRVRAEVLTTLLARFKRSEWLPRALDAVCSDDALFDHAADGAVLAYVAEHPKDAAPILRTLARTALRRRDERSSFVERVARDIEGIAKMLLPSPEKLSELPSDAEDVPMSVVWRSLEQLAR